MPPSGVKCFVFRPDKEAKVRLGGNFWALNAVYPRSLAPFYPPLSFVHCTMMLCVKDRGWGRLKGGLQGGTGFPHSGQSWLSVTAKHSTAGDPLTQSTTVQHTSMN